MVTLNGWTLPWRMNGDWKEFHLVAEPVVREIAPGMKAHLWGYNGQSPGPTIEAVEGDKVRIFVTNKLPEHTTVHWHGMLLPNGMDGVGGLTQPHIKPGKTFVYEFALKKSGTFMYHPHADEMVQMAMGMMGFFVIHPRDPKFMRVDRDFVFLLNAYDVDPGSYVPKVMTMLDFNLWTFNSRVFPGIDHLVGAQGRPRARAGRQPDHDQPSDPHARLPLRGDLHRRRLGAGARALAGGDDRHSGRRHARLRVRRPTNPGDWALHCHKSHHTMNAMGHDVKTYIGVQKRDLARLDQAAACPTTWRWARAAWPKWARWKCRCPTTRCR